MPLTVILKLLRGWLSLLARGFTLPSNRNPVAVDP
jgi:hypothetical protein